MRRVSRVRGMKGSMRVQKLQVAENSETTNQKELARKKTEWNKTNEK